jgi:hypothetical protein
MIVWLASFPRSGNTMFRMLLQELYGVRSHSVYDESPAAVPDPDTLLGVAGSMRLAGLPQGLADDDGIHFVKTHEGPTDSSPAVCLVRDGRDALVSYAHFQRSFIPAHTGRPFETVLRELITSRHVFHSWSENVASWCRRSSAAPNAWVRYEDMVKDPLTTVARCLHQLRIELPKVGETIRDFAELQQRWPKFFRKGKTGAWREEMPDELHRLFWQHHGSMMERFGYLEDRPSQLDATRHVA